MQVVVQCGPPNSHTCGLFSQLRLALAAAVFRGEAAFRVVGEAAFRVVGEAAFRVVGEAVCGLGWWAPRLEVGVVCFGLHG